MSTPFTTARGSSWQTMHPIPFSTLPENPTILDEIYLALKERVWADEDWWEDDINEIEEIFARNDEYRNLQGDWYEFFATIQEKIQDMATGYFLDYVNGPLLDDLSDFLYFYDNDDDETKTWREAAGLNPFDEDEEEGAAFRRVRNWDGFGEPTYEYGWAQFGDVIGPWIFEDIQKGLSALRHTSHMQNAGYYNEIYAEAGYAGGDCATGLINFNAAWAAANWGPNIAYTALSYMVGAQHNVGHGGWIPLDGLWRAKRHRGVARVSGLPVIAHSADTYLWYDIDDTWGSWAFTDLDGLGVAENTMVYYNNISETLDTSHETNLLGDSMVNPVSLSVLDCTTGGIPNCMCLGFWLCKWAFTNQG